MYAGTISKAYTVVVLIRDSLCDTDDVILNHSAVKWQDCKQYHSQFQVIVLMVAAVLGVGAGGGRVEGSGVLAPEKF